MASNIGIGLLWVISGRLVVSSDAKQVNYSYLLDNKLVNGIEEVATSWQLCQRILLFLNSGPQHTIDIVRRSLRDTRTTSYFLSQFNQTSIILEVMVDFLLQSC